ncbi:TIGR01244 family sulfur transferase [Oceaniglobus trochenteri]|uniref:TIGR01244 family sulfur transferase n=1 Tax=Oceaniglobus trochenteri TaxID=2763260 RepID=UPI001CFF6800|nr:TIGR01244 family sulfur transferase [Oceaniglobus trochenteri]
MQINTLTDDYAVAGQIEPDDMAALKKAGFTSVICNRPDEETGPGESSVVMAQAADAAGLKFTYNPVISGAMSNDNIAVQRSAVADSEGPVFAYCRSGMRSSVVWALSQAAEAAPDDLIAAAARGGYDLNPLRAQIEAAARG